MESSPPNVTLVHKGFIRTYACMLEWLYVWLLFNYKMVQLNLAGILSRMVNSLSTPKNALIQPDVSVDNSNKLWK
jgi:hypothetical protein